MPIQSWAKEHNRYVNLKAAISYFITIAYGFSIFAWLFIVGYKTKWYVPFILFVMMFFVGGWFSGFIKMFVSDYFLAKIGLFVLPVLMGIAIYLTSIYSN